MGVRGTCPLATEVDITLGMDDDVMIKVRRITMDNETATRQEHVARLKKSFRKASRDMGHREWNREDLHADRAFIDTNILVDSTTVVNPF